MARRHSTRITQCYYTGIATRILLCRNTPLLPIGEYTALLWHAEERHSDWVTGCIGNQMQINPGSLFKAAIAFCPLLEYPFKDVDAVSSLYYILQPAGFDPVIRVSLLPCPIRRDIQIPLLHHLNMAWISDFTFALPSEFVVLRWTLSSDPQQPFAFWAFWLKSRATNWWLLWGPWPVKSKPPCEAPLDPKPYFSQQQTSFYSHSRHLRRWFKPIKFYSFTSFRPLFQNRVGEHVMS